jgi:hypothetical protein
MYTYMHRYIYTWEILVVVKGVQVFYGSRKSAALRLNPGGLSSGLPAFALPYAYRDDDNKSEQRDCQGSSNVDEGNWLQDRGNWGNIKSLQRGSSRLRLCFLQPDLSLTELFLRAPAHTLLNFHCLRVTVSYQIS